MGNRLALWLAALLFLVAPAYADTLTFPPLTGRVVDTAHILTPEQSAGLNAKLTMIETTTGHQLVIATIPDLKGHDIADYGYQLGRSWGIGTKGKNDGALILVAPTERKVRIEVGYGLEPIVTDALSEVIISQNITPAFKAGDYTGGLNAGVDALGGLLKLPPDEAAARAKQMVTDQAAADAQAQSGRGLGHLLPLIFFLLIFISPRLFGRGRGYGGGIGGAVGQVALWSMLDSGRGSSGFGGNDGGGGFGGGGGSFGGGGSSGSW